jgi:hypothetical protein
VSEGDAWFSTMEYVATGPAALAPAQTVQLSQLGICWILLFTTAVEGGAGRPGAGVGVGAGVGAGVGVGVGVLPLTVRVKGALKYAPVESQA